MNKILFNPFEKYSEKRLLLIGIICSIFGVFISHILNVRFDGVLDLHVVKELSIRDTLIDTFSNLFSMILSLLILSKVINIKSRTIDIITIVLISRIPYYTLSLFNIKEILFNATNEALQMVQSQSLESSSTSFTLIIFSIISLLFLAWYMSLLYNGFKVASNAKGSKPVVLFIITILISEALSKYLIGILTT